ncbi:MAG: hypothetical protein M5R36_01170 [Deltaproteobacteria bacterium]|nr:hypothetical protein [Deltaproteobacteria bacterium]
MLIINKGKIVADDTPGALEQKNEGALTLLTVRGDGDIIAALKSFPGVTKVRATGKDGAWQSFELSMSVGADGLDNAERVFDAVVERGWKIAELRSERVRLEDVFAHLTRS